jgi:hypothetical protein
MKWTFEFGDNLEDFIIENHNHHMVDPQSLVGRKILSVTLGDAGKLIFETEGNDRLREKYYSLVCPSKELTSEERPSVGNRIARFIEALLALSLFPPLLLTLPILILRLYGKYRRDNSKERYEEAR